MTDKEVGELWEAYRHGNDLKHVDVQALIRKLVEERVRRLRGSLRGREPGTPTDLELTLSQFGIPPETWHDE